MRTLHSYSYTLLTLSVPQESWSSRVLCFLKNMHIASATQGAHKDKTLNMVLQTKEIVSGNTLRWYPGHARQNSICSTTKLTRSKSENLSAKTHSRHHKSWCSSDIGLVTPEAFFMSHSLRTTWSAYIQLTSFPKASVSFVHGFVCSFFEPAIESWSEEWNTRSHNNYSLRFQNFRWGPTYIFTFSPMVQNLFQISPDSQVLDNG